MRITISGGGFGKACAAALLLGSLVGLSGISTAQTFHDTFTYANGTTVPGYTEERGDWRIAGGTVHSQASPVFQELTENAQVSKDGCVELVAIFNRAAPALMYTGVLMRHTGSGATARFFMTKLVGDTQSNAWTNYVTYYHDGSNFVTLSALSGALPGSTTRARLRLQVMDEPSGTRVQIFIDTDLDGLWNVSASTLTSMGTGTQGAIGVAGYNGGIADDLKFYNAALYLDGPPRVGASVGFKGRATAGLLYQGACSFGRSGTPLGAGQALPINWDILFFVSLTNPLMFSRFTGVTDGNGLFGMTLNTPAIPALAGVTIWSSAVTLQNAAIHEIAPDVQVTFVP